MYSLESNEKAVHKEAATKRVKRDGEDVQRLLACFSSGLMTDPYTQEITDLLNFATGVVLTGDLADALVTCTKKGREQMSTFIGKRINTNTIILWDPITKRKVKLFETTTRKAHLKAADERLITLKADRELFGRLLIVANARKINLREVLSYEYMQNPKNKINLCDFLTSSLCKIGQERLTHGKRLIIGAGFIDGERTVGITRARPTEEISVLKSIHKEADTRMILHAAFAVRESPTSVIVIQSPDTDVLVLCISHFTGIGCRELWFRTGVSDHQIHFSAFYPAKPRRKNVAVSISIPRPHWLRFNKQHIPSRKEETVDYPQTQRRSPDNSQRFWSAARLRRDDGK